MCPDLSSLTAAESFVQRLLATEDEAKRRDLSASHGLNPTESHEAGLLLASEATRLVGARPLRMEQISLNIMALAEQTADEYLWALGCAKLGDALRAQGRNAEAVDRLDTSAAVFTRLDRLMEGARTRANWIMAKGALGRVDEALAAVPSARRVLVANGDTLHLAILHLNTGGMLIGHGRYREAMRYFGIALRLSSSLGTADRIGIVRARSNRALVLTRTGRHREALVELEFARTSYLELGEAAGYQRVMMRFGENQMALGRYTAALQTLEPAWQAARELGSYADAVSLAYYVADCYLHFNRPLDALRTLDEAEHDLAHTDNATDALGLAVRRVTAHLLLDEQDKALAAQEAAEQRFPTGADQHRAWLATQRAAILARFGSPASALVAAHRAARLARACDMRRLLSFALLAEGGAMLGLGDLDGARVAVRRARRLAVAEDAAPLLYRAEELTGRIKEAEGRPIAAERRYAAAVAQLEREQQGVIFEFRESFAQVRGLAYERLAALQITGGRAHAALETVERAKSRALVDAITGRVELRPRGNATARRLARELAVAREDNAAAASSAGRDEPLVADARAERARRLSEQEARITGLIQKLQMAGASDDLAGLYRAPASFDLPPLPHDTCLLEFFFSGDDVIRFRVDADGVHGDILARAAPDLERLLRAFRLNLDTTEDAEPERRERLATQLRAILARLHDRLLAGIGDLDRYRALVVVPHGLLHYLPFHALFDGERYLIERFAISYAPSATLYGVCQGRAERGRRTGPPLVLAHSAGGRLPYTGTEADAVGAVLKVPVHRDGAATRALLKDSGRRAGIIHLAAHAWFRPDVPLFSGVELGDGVLTTADVFNLDLSAVLVTLSACETGRVQIGAGDELAGLTRAFLYAGAAALLVSQWRVDDASTAVLMTRFYQELAAGAGPAAALRAAQLAVLSGEMPQNERTHPFYWAGFQVIGAASGPPRHRGKSRT